MNFFLKLFVVQLLFCFLLLQRSTVYGNWVLTASIKEEYQNGSNGLCEYGGDDGVTHVCYSGWRNIGIRSGLLLEQTNGCRYFNMSREFECRNPDTAGVICRRSVLFYQIRSECFNQWLGWQDCSENSVGCNLGISRRYMFTSTTTFRFQTRPCHASSCAIWGPWVKPPGLCDGKCTKIWSRDCFLRGRKTSIDKCSQNVFTGPFGNLTHQLFPCVQQHCINPELPNPFLYNAVELRPPPVPIATTTVQPVTKTDRPESGSNVFSMETFWVGFCVGMAAAFAILLIVGCLYAQTWKGRATIAAIKTYRHNEKLYYNRKRRQDAEPTLVDLRGPMCQSRLPMAYSRNSFRHDVDGKTVGSSMSSLRSWKKDEGYRSNLNSGSISGHSKYQESLNQAQPPYGTYYTPVGEDKLLNRQRRPPLPHIVHADVQKYRETDSLDSESVSESIYDSPRYVHDANGSVASLDIRKGAFYYEKHFEAQSRKQKGDFDEDSYIKNYQAYRHERNLNESPSSSRDERIHRVKSPERVSRRSRSSVKTNYSQRRSEEERLSPRPSKTLDYNYAKIKKRNERLSGKSVSKQSVVSYPENIHAITEKLRAAKENQYKHDENVEESRLPLKVDLNDEKWQYPEKKPLNEEKENDARPDPNLTKLQNGEEDEFEFPLPPQLDDIPS